MTGNTNPYQTWLGLNVSSRPDCYTLLGLPLYEADGGKIMVAAQNAMARASIPMAPSDEPARQALVSEIQLAQNCLLDPAQKQAYDQQLQAYYSGQTAAATAQPVAAAQPVSQPVTPVATPSAAPTSPVASSDSSSEPLIQSKKQSAASTAKRRARNSAFTTYAGFALVLITALGGGGYYYFFMKPAEEVAQQDQDPQPVPQAKDPAPAEPATPAEEPDDTETEKPTGPNIPQGKRPTSAELANSIPGLGNPDETMAGMDEMPSMMNKPPEPTATPEQQAELQTAFMTAWTGIGARDFAKASIALNNVRELPKTNEGKAHFEQVDQFVQDLMAFNKALNEGIETLAEEEELTVGTTKFTVTVVDDNRIVVRFANQNKAFERDNLPEGFQRALAISRLKGDDAAKQRIEASYLLLSPKAEAEYVRDLWMKAGADGGALAALEADKKKYVASEMVAAAPSGMPADGADEMPSDTTPDMAPANGGETSAAQVAKIVDVARKQLVDRNPSAAQQALSSIDATSLTPENQAKLTGLQQVVDLNTKFWDAVSKRLTKLPADEDLDVNGTLTRVVESDANRLVLRMAGENKRYTLTDMPPGLAKFLAEEELPANVETKKIIGAFLLVTPEGGVDRAKEEWATGFLPQEDITQLVAGMTAPLDMKPATNQPVAIPSDTALAAPGDALAKKWNARIASAKEASDHVDIAKQLLEAAKSQPDGSPGQFVAFRLALAEGARGADFDLCSTIIQDWSARFAISAGEWHYKAMQLAGSSTDAASVHAAITRHAISQIPVLRAAGEDNFADAMQRVAQQSATKANDQALIEAVRQLSGNS